MIVDFHNHYYPEAYLAELERGNTVARLRRDERGRTLLDYAGDYNVIAPGHRDLDVRLGEMDAGGVDVHAFSLTTPGVHVEEPGRGVELARVVNDAFAEAAAQHPGRFAPLAALPLQDPAAAAREAERAVTELGHRGVTLFSNVNGRSLDDEAYLPLFERLEALGVPAFLHPTSPRSLAGVEEFRLTAILGFLFDTTVAVTRLVFAGVPERFPGLTLVLAHLGGTVPYVAERADRGFHAYEECRRHLTRPPTELFQGMYYDTVNFSPHALRLALEFVGAGRLVFGSDYPHEVGSTGRALRAVQGLALKPEARRAILGGTASRLLGLEGANASPASAAPAP